jgi:hypothetical protein
LSHSPRTCIVLLLCFLTAGWTGYSSYDDLDGLTCSVSLNAMTVLHVLFFIVNSAAIALLCKKILPYPSQPLVVDKSMVSTPSSAASYTPSKLSSLVVVKRRSMAVRFVQSIWHEERPRLFLLIAIAEACVFTLGIIDVVAYSRIGSASASNINNLTTRSQTLSFPLVLWGITCEYTRILRLLDAVERAQSRSLFQGTKYSKHPKTFLH